MAALSKLIQLKKLYLEQSLGFKYSDDWGISPQNNNNSHNMSSTNHNTISSLNQNISSCHLCPSAKTRNSILKGDGSKMASMFFILPVPDLLDDDNGIVLGGRNGALFDKILANVLNIKRESVYLSYVVKCKLNNSEKPSHLEISNCKDYLLQELNIIKPKLIISLGEDSFRFLTGNKDDFSKTRLRVLKFMDYDLINTFHPSDLLKNPSLKKEAFMDFKLIKSFI